MPVPLQFTRPGSYVLRAVCKPPEGSPAASSITHERTVVVPTGRPATLWFPADHMVRYKLVVTYKLLLPSGGAEHALMLLCKRWLLAVMVIPVTLWLHHMILCVVMFCVQHSPAHATKNTVLSGCTDAVPACTQPGVAGMPDVSD